MANFLQLVECFLVLIHPSFESKLLSRAGFLVVLDKLMKEVSHHMLLPGIVLGLVNQID